MKLICPFVLLVLVVFTVSADKSGERNGHGHNNNGRGNGRGNGKDENLESGVVEIANLQCKNCD